MAEPWIVRPAGAADIHAIYGHHVLHGTASFEETPPIVEEMAARGADVLSDAYASDYRPRSAYRLNCLGFAGG